jgi:hypothetical protein
LLYGSSGVNERAGAALGDGLTVSRALHEQDDDDYDDDEQEHATEEVSAAMAMNMNARSEQ